MLTLPFLTVCSSGERERKRGKAKEGEGERGGGTEGSRGEEGERPSSSSKGTNPLTRV